MHSVYLVCGVPQYATLPTHQLIANGYRGALENQMPRSFGPAQTFESPYEIANEILPVSTKLTEFDRTVPLVEGMTLYPNPTFANVHEMLYTCTGYSTDAEGSKESRTAVVSCTLLGIPYHLRARAQHLVEEYELLNQGETEELTIMDVGVLARYRVTDKSLNSMIWERDVVRAMPSLHHPNICVQREPRAITYYWQEAAGDKVVRVPLLRVQGCGVGIHQGYKVYIGTLGWRDTEMYGPPAVDGKDEWQKTWLVRADSYGRLWLMANAELGFTANGYCYKNWEALHAAINLPQMYSRDDEYGRYWIAK